MGLWPIATLVLMLSFLMVSTVRYRTFKEAGLNARTLLVFLLIIAVGMAVAIRGRPSLVLLVYFSFYILLGIGGRGAVRPAAARGGAGRGGGGRPSARGGRAALAGGGGRSADGERAATAGDDGEQDA